MFTSKDNEVDNHIISITQVRQENVMGLMKVLSEWAQDDAFRRWKIE